MKKYLSLLLICLCMSITGCGKNNIFASGEQVQTEALSGKKAAGLETAGPETKETEPETLSPEEEASALLQTLYKKDARNEGAYRLPIKMKAEDMIIHMECSENYLLLLTLSDKMNLLLFDLDTGKTAASRTFDLDTERLGDCGFLEDGRIWFYAADRGRLFYLDRKFEILKEDYLPKAYQYSWFSDYQEDILWSLNTDGKTLFSYDVKSGKEVKYNLNKLLGIKLDSETYWWSLGKASHGFAYLTVMKGLGNCSCYCISAEDGTAVLNELLSTTSMVFNGDCAAYFFSGNYRLVDLSDPETVINLKEMERQNVVGYEDYYMFCSSDERLSIYDMEKGLYYDGYQLETAPQEGFWSFISGITMRKDTSQVIFSVEYPEEKQLILYDMANLLPQTAQLERESEKTVKQKLKQEWNELESEFGIDLLTTAEAMKKPDSSGYHLEKIGSIMDKWDAVSTLKQFLETMPAGMMKEIVAGIGNPLEICFSSTITGESDEGNLNSAGAYVTFWYDEKIQDFITRMTADVTIKTDLLRNMSHEFLHLMEEHFTDCEFEIYNEEEKGLKVISAEEKARQDILRDWESKWEKMSPSESYFYDYDESVWAYEENELDYIYTDGKSMKKVYFIDSYSRTYPKEDRARIFEYLYMAGFGQELPTCFESPHIRKKAVYLCELIRCCYSSVDSETRNPWEAALSDKEWKRILKNRSKRLSS
ncbi:MAG: hypothetical protein Q4F21_03775 [Lachnospiraceae bacterium]|nr:hypothetical protein [Lachnospiraceae bacterium]